MTNQHYTTLLLACLLFSCLRQDEHREQVASTAESHFPTLRLQKEPALAQKASQKSFSPEVVRKSKSVSESAEVSSIDPLTEQSALRARDLGFALLTLSIGFIFILILYRQSQQNYQLTEELEERVQRRTKNLEASNQALQRFAFIASHDLKTPLRTIVSMLSLIKRKIQNLQNTELEELMQMTINNAKQMTDMIDHLLTFARINSSVQPLEHKPVPLDAIVESVRTKIEQVNPKGNWQIRSSSLPVVSGSAVRLYQLLQNLITNGLKYNRSNCQTVEIKTLPQTGDYHLIQVTDNGIGIPEEYRQKVFEMFQRLHSNGDYEGTGIGLALCKLIVEQYGGEIWIEDNPQGGTSFTFTLPRYPNSQTNTVVE